MDTRTIDLSTRLLALAILLVGPTLLSTACGPGGGANTAPTITLDVGSEEEYVIGEDIIQIRVTATDEQGDALSFSVADKPERAEFQTFDQKAIFTWDPITSDVTEQGGRKLTFVVADEHDASSEKVVRVHIKPGNGRPQFRNSSSKLYDVNSTEPIGFEVEVRDDDSETVDIAMPAGRAPTGASFEQTGDKSGSFEWDPTPSQEEKRVHSVTFIARDMETEPVEQTVTIIFKERTNDVDPDNPPVNQQECEEEKPIQFEPLPAQHTGDDYPIQAKFSAEAAAKYDGASVLWTTKDPLNNDDIDFRAENLTIDGRTISGSLPNLELPGGTTEIVFYAICALDEDAEPTAEDAFVCSPKRDFHSFVAYPAAEGACADDMKGANSTSQAATLSNARWKHFRLCDGQPDFHSFTVGPDQTVDAFFTYPDGQEISFQVFDDQMNPQPDALARSACSGLALARIKHGAGEGPSTYYVKVTGKDIPYQTIGSGVRCSDDVEEPNNSVDEATIATDNKTYPGLSICQGDRDIFVFEMLKGDEFDSSLAFANGAGNLDATLFAPDQESMVAEGNDGVAKSWSMTDGESITYTATESGLFHLLVFSRGEANTYDLDFQTNCRDNDDFSGNHSRQKAGVVKLQNYPEMKICGGQPDWYQRTGFKDTTLGVTLTAKNAATAKDMGLTIYDENGMEVAESIDIDEQRYVDVTPSTSGKQFYFEVDAPKGVIYDIKFEHD